MSASSKLDGNMAELSFKVDLANLSRMADALRYLAQNPRPSGGNEYFNSEDLHMLADGATRLLRTLTEHQPQFGQAQDRKHLLDAIATLESLSNWRKDARAHDRDMGNEPRDFCEDVEMFETSARQHAARLRELIDAPNPMLTQAKATGVKP